jgi:phage shock protein C
METTQTMSDRLYRSSTDKYIGGVCGGLAEHFRIDPSIIRVLAVLLTLGTGIGLILYIVMWIVVPQRPYGEVAASDKPIAGWNSYLPGVILIGVGAILLIVQVFRWLHWHMIWPIFLILIGLGLVFYHGNKSNREPRVY